MKTLKLLIGLIAISVMASCTPLPSKVMEDKNKSEVEQALAQPATQPSHTGSLWAYGSTTFFTDSKASNVGDLITILVSEKASATRSLGSKKARKSSQKSGVTAALGLEQYVSTTPSTAVDISNEKSFDGSGETTNSDTLTASVTAVVTKVYANGNLRIVGRRQVIINQQPQELTFTGIIRRLDISPTNTIPSSKVAQANISYGGGGDLATVTNEGWLGQVLDQIWPF